MWMKLYAHFLTLPMPSLSTSLCCGGNPWDYFSRPTVSFTRYTVRGESQGTHCHKATDIRHLLVKFIKSEMLRGYPTVRNASWRLVRSGLLRIYIFCKVFSVNKKILFCFYLPTVHDCRDSLQRVNSWPCRHFLLGHRKDHRTKPPAVINLTLSCFSNITFMMKSTYIQF